LLGNQAGIRKLANARSEACDSLAASLLQRAADCFCIERLYSK
jgi:hypothetical protein